MKFEIKKRHIIHYILIVICLIVLSIIYLLIYNEYFNEKKLQSIKNQIEYTNRLKNLSKKSITELINAQHNLNKFINAGKRKNLDCFSASLNRITKNIDSLNIIESSNSELKYDLIETNQKKLSDFKKTIDSIEKIKIPVISKSTTYKPKEVEFKDTISQSEDEIQYSMDNTFKKGFFRRFIDAFKGGSDVRRDTVFIKTKYGITLDTNKVKVDFDSIINLINKHYSEELNKYQSFIFKTNLKNNKLYQTYDKLIWTGIELMNIYENVIDSYNNELMNQFNEQNSKINTIRKYSTLGLIILIFFVLILLLYYTNKSFKYESELNKSNKLIKEDLNFKNRLLGMLSHEIRSPLKIINIFINKINKKTNDDSVKSYLDLISYTNNVLLIQSNQILEYTKNQHSPIILNPVEFNLKNEIDNIIIIFTPFIESKGNILVNDSDIDSGITVVADRIKIHQLFSNILGNANKFTENGKITTNITASALQSDSIILKVIITDTGSGIAQSDIVQIFEPFYQGIISDKIDNIGAGLGLSLCKEIVDIFKGEITIESELNKGAKVSFGLELKIKK